MKARSRSWETSGPGRHAVQKLEPRYESSQFYNCLSASRARKQGLRAVQAFAKPQVTKYLGQRASSSAEGSCRKLDFQAPLVPPVRRCTVSGQRNRMEETEFRAIPATSIELLVSLVKAACLCKKFLAFSSRVSAQ